MARKVLLIAFQFPPFAGSSAVQRTLRFAQYLPEFGWEPIVLTAHPRAFGRVSQAQMEDVPEGVHVERAFALDAARHLSIRGWFPRALALPDRWSSWLLGAVPAGLRLIREFRPDVIWSTYPVATTMLVGGALRRLSRLPWVADFRDPMYDESYPTEPMLRRCHRMIERWTIRGCERAVFTSPGAVRVYRARYPDVPHDRFCLIENGFDEASFRDLSPAPPLGDERFSGVTLVHSGVVYPVERDPRALFAALADLRAGGDVSEVNFRLLLRASGHDGQLRALAAAAGVERLLRFLPAIPYREALSEMVAADGLVVLQGDDCSYQIPAKVYECLRAGRPVVGLVGEETDTANLLRGAGIPYVAPLHSRERVREVMQAFLRDVRAGVASRPRNGIVAGCERRGRARELAQLLDDAAGKRTVQ